MPSIAPRGAAPPRPPGARALAAAVLVALTLCAFWPVRDNGFVLFDDAEYLVNNEVVRRGLTAEGVRLAFTRSYAGNWFPLTWLSHMVDVELFGLAPRGHHLVGLGIHVAAALLLLLTLRAMTGRAGPSFVVAALFAVHPLRVESVAWAAERKDVLAAFFWMATTALYLRHARRPGATRYAAALACFAVGLASKQMLVTLPLVLLLLDFWPLGRWRAMGAGEGRGQGQRWRGPAWLVLEKLPFAALAGLASRLAVEAQGSVGLIHSFQTFPLAGRVANAFLAPVRYLGMAAWPTGLTIFYPYERLSLTEARVLGAAALLAAASLGALLARRRLPWLCTGWFWYLVTLVPVVGLVQIGDQALADRYTYLPLVGVFLAVAWTPAALPGPRGARRPAALALLAAAVLVALAGLTRRQTALWRDDETLFSHALRVTSGNWVATYFLGRARGAAGAFDDAERLLRESIRIKPDFESSRVELAYFLHDRGRDAEAIEELRAGAAALPRSRRLWLTLSRALRDAGRRPEMLEALREAVAALPGDHELRLTLAFALTDAGRLTEAEDQYREVIRRWPTLPDPLNNLAVLLAGRGETAEAAALLRRALEIDPAYLDARKNLEALESATGAPAAPAPAAPAPGTRSPAGE